MPMKSPRAPFSTNAPRLQERWIEEIAVRHTDLHIPTARGLDDAIALLDGVMAIGFSMRTCAPASIAIERNIRVGSWRRADLDEVGLRSPASNAAKSQ